MEKKRRYSKNFDKKLGLLRTGKEAAVFAVILAVLFLFIIGISRISGASMEPTLHDGQPVVFLRLQKNYARGDVAAVRTPAGEWIVKRVAAVGGDTVDVADDMVTVNGVPAGPLAGPTAEKDLFSGYPLELAEGQIFVLGDNSAVSVDSRTYGPLSVSQTRGKILGY